MSFDDNYPTHMEAEDHETNVVDFMLYADFMAREEKSSAKKPVRGKAADDGGEVPDEELASRLMRYVEFDQDAAIERARNKRWLIYGILPHADVGYLYGAPGSYKSFMAVDIASHVASATKWNGIDVDYPGAVLYIAGEGASELHVRKKAWGIATGQDNTALTILERGVNINSVTERTELKALIREVERITGNRHVLIVIDTFSKCFEGDENSSEDMRKFIAGCEDLRDSFSGCCVMFVGHTGNADKTRMRGSSAALADCGFVYRISRGKQKLYAEMRCDKIKDATEPDDMAFNFEVWQTGDRTQKGVPLCSLVPKMTAVLEREDTEAGDVGRAEVLKKTTASERNKKMLIGTLKSRLQLNDGEPVPRMQVRGDLMKTFMHSEKMSESAAKMAWSRAWFDAQAEGLIIACDGDHWKLKPGV